MYSKLQQRGILSSLVVTIARVEVAACGEGHTIEHSIHYAEHIVFVYRYTGYTVNLLMAISKFCLNPVHVLDMTC